MTETELLARLPDLAFATALLIARVGSACMLIPGPGETEMPAMIRAGFTLALVAVLLPALLPDLPPAPSHPALAAGMVGAEVLCGLWLGWLARLVLLALPVAGQIIAGLTGLANVIQPDSALGPQTAALGKLFGLAAPVVVFTAGLHALPFAALAGSYRLIPAGTLLPAADMLQTAVAAVADSFALAMRLAAPFLLGGIVWQVGMALVSRLVPQLQIFVVATPAQIVGGLLLLGLLAGAMVDTWRDQAAATFALLPGH